MRIFVPHPSALLTDHRPHGDGLVASGLLRELGARGHDVHVATQQIDVRTPLPANVRLYRLEDSERLGPAARLRYMVRVRRLFARLHAERPFDVVHQLNPVDVGLSLGLAGSRTPVVLGPHVPDWPPAGAGADAVVGPVALALKRAVRTVQQHQAATVLLSSPAALAKLEAGWPGRLQVAEVPPGIDTSAWTPGDGAGERLDVLFLANLQTRKGIFVLLDAFPALAARLAGARLVVGGHGPAGDEVRRRVEASPHRARIELLGAVDRDRAPALMRSCSVFCAPSYAEPFGMTALEAMACARPVVATRAGGLQHLIGARGGRTVPPGDPTALAAALGELLEDAGLRRAMGAHNREVVEQRYAWARVVDRLEAVYGEAAIRRR